MFKIKEINVTSIVDTDPNVYVMRAEDNLKRHQYEEALREMDKAIEYAPENKKGKYAFEKIKIFDVIGHHSQSAEFIKKYMKKLYSELPLSDFYRVLRVLKKNSTSDLSSILKQNKIPPVLLQVYQSGQSSKSFFMKRVEDYLNKSQFADALAMTKLINERFKVDSDFYLLNGRIYRAQGSYSKAITYYEKAANYRNPRLEVFIEIAEVNELLNEIGKALRWIDKGLDIHPYNQKLLHLKANILYKNNLYEQCLGVLDTILKKDSEDANAFYMKGLVYDHLKLFFFAKSNFKKAEVMNPDLSIPENLERERYLIRMKKLVIVISTVTLLLLIGQFVLFKTGIIKPIVKNATLDTYGDLFLGETAQLYDDYDYFPSYAKEPDLKYKITNPDIAKVNSKGEIKGLNVGSTVIQLVHGKKVLATSLIEVVNPEVATISIDLFNQNLTVGDTAKLSTTVEMVYKEVEIPEITYSSSDPSIISVNEEGEIEAVDIGEATITATAGEKISNLTIYSYAKVEEIHLVPEDLRVIVGKTIMLKPTVKTTPENGGIYPLKYETSDSSIATVNTKGEVTGVSAGQAEITISSLNGIEKRIKVLVTRYEMLDSPSGLIASYDMETKSINVSWNYDSSLSEDIEFKVSCSKDNEGYSTLTTSEETSFNISGIFDGHYSFRVVAVADEYESDPAFVSLTIPNIYKEDNNNTDLDSNFSDSTYEEGTEESNTVAQTPEEIQEDKHVENMIKLMSSVVGYWKNVSPDNSDYRELKYAIIGNTSTESRKNSFNISFLAKSYYFGETLSIWEYGLRSNWIKIEGNKLIDTEEAAITIYNSDRFTVEFKTGKTCTFVRCKKTDIPDDYLRNSTVDLP